MTEQEIDSWILAKDGFRDPDMWSKINGEPYFRVSLGVGDAINLSGAAIYLAKSNKGFVWHTIEANEKSIRSIFALNPEVSVVSIPNWGFYPMVDTEPCHTLLIKQETIIPSESTVDFYEHVYASHGIPYQARWDLCPISASAKLVPQDPIPIEARFCFVHESPQSGHRIDRSLLPKDLPWYGPDRGLDLSILAYVDTLKAATEIHVIDSAIMHLVESIDTEAKLFLHHYSKKTYVKGWNSYKTRHKWKILN